MTVLAFDTLKAANRLRQAGFDEKQAHELVTTFAEGMGENVATKDDLALMKGDLKGEIDGLRKELKADIENLRKDTTNEFGKLRSELRELEQRMTIKLGGMLVAGVAFLTVLNRLFPPG